MTKEGFNFYDWVRDGRPHSVLGEVGKENYMSYFSPITKKNLVQYDYRHTDGELFSCVRQSLEECRAKRDEWLKAKGGAV